MLNLWIVYSYPPPRGVLLGEYTNLLCACKHALMIWHTRHLLFNVFLTAIWHRWNLTWDFQFERCVVPKIWYFLALTSWPCTFVNIWGQAALYACTLPWWYRSSSLPHIQRLCCLGRLHWFSGGNYLYPK